MKKLLLKGKKKIEELKEKNKNIRMWLVTHTFAARWGVYLFFIVTTLVMGIYGVEYGEAAAIYAQF